MGHWSSLGGHLWGGGYLSLGGVSQVVVHPLGVLFVLGGQTFPCKSQGVMVLETA